MLVKDLPTKERPVTRVRENPEGVSLAELLAVLISGANQVEVAHDIITRFGDRLSEVLPEELAEVPGVGPVVAARIHAALELGRRMNVQNAYERFSVRCPSDAANIAIPLLGHKDREHFLVIYLNTRHHVMEHEVLYKGTLDTSPIRTAEVFRGAIRRNCAAIMIAHNHPSGDPTPSPQDVALTQHLVEAGELMEIKLLDHIVVGGNRYVSMRERLLGFEGF